MCQSQTLSFIKNYYETKCSYKNFLNPIGRFPLKLRHEIMQSSERPLKSELKALKNNFTK